jgi:flagellar biogenesis protein FliO
MIEKLAGFWNSLRRQKYFAPIGWTAVLVVVLALGLLIGGPNRPRADNSDPLAGGTTLALSVFLRWIAVIGLMYIGFILFRRWWSNRGGAALRRLNIAERLHLSPRQALYLVKVGEREFLVSATDQNIHLLTELEPELDESPATDLKAAEKGFSSIFHRNLNPSNPPLSNQEETISSFSTVGGIKNRLS